MLETKRITLDDKGTQKAFTIQQLPVMQAMKLLREFCTLLADTELISSLVMQQFIQNLIQTGSKDENVDIDQLQRLSQMGTPDIVSHFIKSIITGLDDDKLDSIVNKCMTGVIYHNGSENRSAVQALQHDMIEDFVVVFALIYEVVLINYAGAIERLKKLLAQRLTAKEQQST